MNTYSVDRRKIDQFCDGDATAQVRPDQTPLHNDRVETGPTALAFSEWHSLGLRAPNVPLMREQRLDALVAQLQNRDLDAILLFDPVNIRYATDAMNMAVWTMRNFARAALVTADAHVVLWDFARSNHLTDHLPLINERRTDASAFFFASGTHEVEHANRFAREVHDLLREHGGGNRLAIDKAEFAVTLALDALGLQMESGQATIEMARLIKSSEELAAMRCAVASCEAAVAEMRAALRPGISEVALWSHLHSGNIARGGEWIETRLLSSGPRTNPWMQEAGPRIIAAGDLVAFDTDLVGVYGMCCDMSRTWICGDATPTARQKYNYQLALDHINQNTQLLEPGVSFRDLSFGGHHLPAAYTPQRYAVKMHGVGLCDEFPSIYYPEDYIDGAFDDHLEPGMVLCVEVYIGEVGGRDGVKLEEMVLVTENGPETLTTYPFEEAFS